MSDTENSAYGDDYIRYDACGGTGIEAHDHSDDDAIKIIVVDIAPLDADDPITVTATRTPQSRTLDMDTFQRALGPAAPFPL